MRPRVPFLPRRRGAALVLAILLAAARPAAAPPQEPPAPPPAGGDPAMPMIVLDPAHGGEDAGARGPGGVAERDLTLSLARAVRAELQRQGLRVLLTREGNEGLSLDDRAALANAQRAAIFVTLHVGSGGRHATARAFYFEAPPGPAPALSGGLLVPWERAQEAYAGRSARLAAAVQAQLAERLPGSPEAPLAAAVRQLRMVAAPAIAVEISAITAEPAALARTAAPLGEALARALREVR